MKILESEEISPVEVKEALEESGDSLKPMQNAGLEHLRENTKIETVKGFNELKEELEGVESLKEKHIFKILEILPCHEKEVEALFSKERLRLDEDEKQKIAEICSSYSA
ncbi:MAG: hypothetical protein SVV03_06225 [Candidatus Nanohaloarchaea archaeon]|nr:hypothetical protein [Candidatus Nanohaloarchaea archaeon]